MAIVLAGPTSGVVSVLHMLRVASRVSAALSVCLSVSSCLFVGHTTIGQRYVRWSERQEEETKLPLCCLLRPVDFVVVVVVVVKSDHYNCREVAASNVQ